MFYWKHNRNNDFSRAQLLGITDSKAPFRGPFPKWHFWNQKCHFGFSPVPAETPLSVVFGDFLWAQKKDHFPKRTSCNENARFLIFRTQIVFAHLSKKSILTNKTFVWQPPKIIFLSGHFFENFLFHFFHLFSFALANIKMTKTKNAFSETLYLTPPQPEKTFSHSYTLFVFFLDTPKHSKTGEELCCLFGKVGERAGCLASESVCHLLSFATWAI